MRTSTSFAMGAVVALVLGSGTAYAATGGNFILGHANSAGTATGLANANGTALSLTAKPGSPALKVNTGAVVPNLNADKLDGVSSSSFARATTIGTRMATGKVDNNGTTADTTDDSVVAIASCPTGSQVTGGGGYDGTDDGILLVDAPNDAHSWIVVSDTQTVTSANAANVLAFARCYNPLTNVASNARTTATTATISPLARQMITAAARKH